MRGRRTHKAQSGVVCSLFAFALLVLAPRLASAQCTACTAFGTDTLSSVTTASEDSAFGASALHADTTGNDNTAVGVAALVRNTTGSFNVASGSFALDFNTTGNSNTASGYTALDLNSTGDFNTASGFNALQRNTSSDNTASGANALFANTTGNSNTADGASALSSNTTGSNNIALGEGAGSSLSTGDGNIDIGNGGKQAEANTIRIGASQSATFIAGITGAGLSPKTSKPVYITSAGQLGIKASHSSARYKRDIHAMADASANLLKLRPVTFRYKDDASGERQFGLVAEEVAKLYPELVTRDDAGRVDGVLYELLPAMLLNEVEKQAAELDKQTAEMKSKDAEIAALRAQLSAQGQRFDSLAARVDLLERQASLSRPPTFASAMR